MAYFALWIEASRCQGNIYEKLYSIDALSQPDDVRCYRVEALEHDLQNLHKATSETNVREATRQYPYGILLTSGSRRYG